MAEKCEYWDGEKDFEVYTGAAGHGFLCGDGDEGDAEEEEEVDGGESTWPENAAWKKIILVLFENPLFIMEGKVKSNKWHGRKATTNVTIHYFLHL